jgi:primosomal protein N' (replication factor Y)
MFSGKSEEDVRSTALDTANRINKSPLSSAVTLLGPAAAPLSKLRGKYRWQILLKAHRYQDLHTVCDSIVQSSPALLGSTKVKMSIDVDPENML